MVHHSGQKEILLEEQVIVYKIETGARLKPDIAYSMSRNVTMIHSNKVQKDWCGLAQSILQMSVQIHYFV